MVDSGLNIISCDVKTILFPFSLIKMKKDSNNINLDYSTIYVILKTDNIHEGHAILFPLEHENEICTKAIEEIIPLVVGKNLGDITKNFGEFCMSFRSECQVRCTEPTKDVIHLAISTIINAIWDLYAKVNEKPLWKLLVDMTPEQIVNCIDFSCITNVLTRDEALDILRKNQSGKDERIKEICQNRYPAYITLTEYPDHSNLEALCSEALSEGWTHFKTRLGNNIDDAVDKCTLIREKIGYENKLIISTNQMWNDIDTINNMNILKKFQPMWIEGPADPNETCYALQNSMLSKNLLSKKDLMLSKLDTCALGINEILATLLIASKYGIQICPTASSVGFCEYAQHISIFNYIYVSASYDNQILEYVDYLHLHAYFENPVVVNNGKLVAPQSPGCNITIKNSSIEKYQYPNGDEWQEYFRYRNMIEIYQCLFGY